MFRILFCLTTLLISWPVAFAGTVQLLDGTTYDGELTVAEGLLVHGEQNVKVALNNVLVARFRDEPSAGEYVPGLVLTNGSRIAGEFSSLAEPMIRFERKGIRIPNAEVAWAIYERFDAALATGIPKGKTGVFLPGGDFFEGTLKGADAQTAKVLNPIFGPRAFSTASKELHAVVVREVKPQPATFEVITSDGSHYLAMDIVIRDATEIVLRHPHYDGLKIEVGDLVEIRAAPARTRSLGLQKTKRSSGSGG